MRRSMNGRSPGPVRDVFRTRWSRWAAIVEAFALRRPARNRVDPIAYGALYKELIAACRTLADSADAEERAYLEDLEVLFSPWLTPRTLARADREILEGLLARCRQVERELGGRGVRFPGLARILKVSLPAIGLAGGLVLLRDSSVDPIAVVGLARNGSDVIWIAARRSTDLQRLGVVAAVVVVASIRVVSRAARS
jgi:hypothetical protein